MQHIMDCIIRQKVDVLFQQDKTTEKHYELAIQNLIPKIVIPEISKEFYNYKREIKLKRKIYYDSMGGFTYTY